jgi:hypothetical protein
VPNHQQRHRTYIASVLGGATSVGSTLIGVLGLLNGFLGILGCALICVPGVITGVFIGALIGDFDGVLGVAFVVSGVLGILHYALSGVLSQVFGAFDGLASSLASSLAILIATSAVVRIAIGTIKVLLAKDRRRGSAAAVVKAAGRLLPAAARDGHVEEWQAWLHDLRESGEPWYRRLAELLSIAVVAIPRLAIILRLRRRQAVD